MMWLFFCRSNTLTSTLDEPMFDEGRPSFLDVVPPGPVRGLGPVKSYMGLELVG